MKKIFRASSESIVREIKRYHRSMKSRMKIKKQTIRERRKINKMIMHESLSNGIS